MTIEQNKKNYSYTDLVLAFSAFISSLYILLVLILGFWFNPLYKEFIFSLTLSSNLFERILLINHLIVNTIIFFIMGFSVLIMFFVMIEELDRIIEAE